MKFVAMVILTIMGILFFLNPKRKEDERDEYEDDDSYGDYL